MKEYIPVIFAAVLLIIAFVLIAAGVSNLAGLPVLGYGSYAYGYLAAGNFSPEEVEEGLAYLQSLL